MCHPRGKEERLRAPLLRLLGIGLGFALLAGSSGHAEVIHLVPEDRASWRARNLFGFVRPGHFYGERKIEIETTPAGATLDLFYVRSNFQKLYEQTEAPATVMLPKRSEAGPRDAVTIRAFLPGYRQKEVSVRVESGQESVLLELDPLPNTLRGLTHTYFGGRASLAFLTDETPQVRVQERAGGFNVILGETGATPEVLAGVDGLHSPVLETVETLQLGEDLLVRIELADGPAAGSVDLRSRASHDPIRDLYRYAVDLVPKDGGVAAVDRAKAALAQVSSRDVTGCALRFDESLRGSLDPAALSRALAPSGSFTDPYLRAAMKRLGEVSPGGRVSMVDGSQLDTRAPLELAAATSQAAQAKGYLALLRRFVRELEPPDQADAILRSIIAPETSPSEFQTLLEQARSAEASCRARAAN